MSMRVVRFTGKELVGALLALGLLLSGCASRGGKPSAGPTYFEHEVAISGETLGAIAAWYTGSVDNWRRIAAANSTLDLNRMRMGTIVRIPSELVTRTDPLPRQALLLSRQPLSLPRQGAAPSTRRSDAGTRESSDGTPGSPAASAPDAARVDDPLAERGKTAREIEQAAENQIPELPEVKVGAGTASNSVPPEVAEASATTVRDGKIAERATAQDMRESASPAAAPARIKTRDELLEELLK